eukprot:3218265-Ditylum_brightwellii.AAC.1
MPPNWADLCWHSAESSTDESVNLALKWLSGITTDVGKDGASGSMSSLPAGRITDPFAMVPDHLSGTAVPNNKSAPTEHTDVNSTH